MRAWNFEAPEADMTFFVGFDFVIRIAIGEVVETSEDNRTNGSAYEVMARLAAIGMPIRRHFSERATLIMQRDDNH